jgi:hypothetical protein
MPPVESVESSDVVDDEPAGELPEFVDGESAAEPDDESAADFDDDEPFGELDVVSGSAQATPGVFATATPIPSDTAKAPTRPIYLA